MKLMCISKRLGLTVICVSVFGCQFEGINYDMIKTQGQNRNNGAELDLHQQNDLKSIMDCGQEVKIEEEEEGEHMQCPACEEGYLYYVKVRDNSLKIICCEECFSIWSDMDSIKNSYTGYDSDGIETFIINDEYVRDILDDETVCRELKKINFRACEDLVLSK